MSKLILPDSVLPSNLRLGPSTKARLVEHDLYDIGRRLQEMHPSVYAVEMDQDDRRAWAIMEDCNDGVQRLIFKTEALDARVLDKLGRIMNVPFEHRMKAAEAEEAQAEADRAENELEQLYENVGRPMWTQMEHDGFIQRGRSYAKGGIYGRRR